MVVKKRVIDESINCCFQENIDVCCNFNIVHFYDIH